MSHDSELEVATRAAVQFAQTWRRTQPAETPDSYSLISYLGLLFGDQGKEQLEVLHAVARGDSDADAMLSTAAASYTHEALDLLLLRHIGPRGTA